MGGNMKSIFYFCIVKSTGRHEAAANKQRFLWPTFNSITDTKRIKVWVNGNVPEVSARLDLTAPCTLILLTSN